jgi:hypothetical protein
MRAPHRHTSGAAPACALCVAPPPLARRHLPRLHHFSAGCPTAFGMRERNPHPSPPPKRGREPDAPPPAAAGSPSLSPRPFLREVPRAAAPPRGERRRRRRLPPSPLRGGGGSRTPKWVAHPSPPIAIPALLPGRHAPRPSGLLHAEARRPEPSHLPTAGKRLILVHAPQALQPPCRGHRRRARMHCRRAQPRHEPVL